MASRSGIASGTPSHGDLSGDCQFAAGSGSVRINVLGPVELVVDGRLVGVRSSRTRRLLAMLALYHDRVVSADRLADGVWGEALPAEPLAALQSQISRLRKLLGRTAAGIETTSGGYRLRSDVVGIDLITFDSVLASAGAELHWTRQGELLDHAIAMVRGAAFEDLEVDDAHIEARRVEDRLTRARLALAAMLVETTAPARTMMRGVPTPVVDVVGRDRDVAAVTELLETKRVVTLTGPGGVGKTTLALVAVDRYCRMAGWRNAFVDLAAVTAHDHVAPALARALGVGRVGTQSWSERLVEAMAGAPFLLLVDNAEHVVDAAAELIGQLVAGTRVVAVTTSRVPLGLPGEQLWAVEPLGWPAPASDLFEQEARAVRPDWSPSRDDTDWIHEICRRVEGLPLAIELAAAQLRWRTPAEIAAALDRPLEALERVPSGHGRHAGLRVVIDGSYQLLDAEQQRYLDQLGVFAGGFTAATAAQVCLPSGMDADTAALHIGALVERALVRAVPGSVSTRYALLDTVRHYALERLERSGQLAGARARHAGAMLEFTERAALVMWGPEEPLWVRRIDDERADICAAHRQLVETDEIELALRLATAAHWVSWPRGWNDLRRLMDGTPTVDKVVAPDVLAPALGVAADLALHDGETQRAADLARRSLATAGGRPVLAQLAHSVLGDLALFAGDTERAITSWRAAGEGCTAVVPGLAPWATAAMALALAHDGRDAEARTFAARAMDSADVSRCPTSRAFARYVAAEASLANDADQAVALLTDAITIASSASAMLVVNLARLTLATLAARRGDPMAAVGQYPAVLQEWRRAGHWAQQWNSLRTLVPALAQVGAAGDAAKILGGLQAHGQAASWGADAADLRGAEMALQRELGDEYAEHLSRGAALTRADLVLFAEDASKSCSDGPG